MQESPKQLMTSGKQMAIFPAIHQNFFPNFFKGRNFVFFLHPPISFPGTLDRFTSNPSICFKTLLTAMEIPRIYYLLGLAVTSLLSFTSSVEQTAFGECYVTMQDNQKRQPSDNGPPSPTFSNHSRQSSTKILQSTNSR